MSAGLGDNASKLLLLQRELRPEKVCARKVLRSRSFKLTTLPTQKDFQIDPCTPDAVEIVDHLMQRLLVLCVLVWRVIYFCEEAATAAGMRPRFYNVRQREPFSDVLDGPA